MRKLFVMSLLVLAIVGVASWNVARAESYTNDTYDWLVHVKHVCGNCEDKGHACDKCKPACEPKCKPACEPKCKPACETKCHSCKPKCKPACEPKCNKCCPQTPGEYPDPCRGSSEPMTRDGLSRQKV
jgi:hypothetical protein